MSTTRALLATLAASGIGVTTALGVAPAANASCASAFGIGNDQYRQHRD